MKLYFVPGPDVDVLRAACDPQGQLNRFSCNQWRAHSYQKIYFANTASPQYFQSTVCIRRGFRGGARGPGPPLSDHTTVTFSGPLSKYFLHSFSIV